MSSMSELAAELGHSLVFPVNCKYCGAPVYLYAAPDGGFAVFDELGPPWPKHRCHGFSDTRTVHCDFTESRSARYKLPVPVAATFGTRPTGSSAKGAVVRIETRHHPRIKKPLWEIDIFDGKLLYRFAVDQQLRLGAYVTGLVTSVHDLGIFLKDVKEYFPPQAAVRNTATSEVSDDTQSMDTKEDESPVQAENIVPVMVDPLHHDDSTVALFARLLGKPIVMVWGIFDLTGKMIAYFPYAFKAEAETYAEKRSAQTGQRHYVQPAKRVGDRQ